MKGLIRGLCLEDIESFERDGLILHASRSDLAVGKHLLAGTAYEPHVAGLFRRRLSAGGAAIDIGANIGYFSMLAASLVGPSGYVLAVEPSASNVKLIEASRRRNAFTQLHVLLAAAGEELGLLAYNSSHSNGIAGAAAETLDGLLSETLVPKIPLDLVVAPERQIDLVKVDVEGGEYLALRGLEQTLKRCHPTIVFAFSPHALTAVSGGDWKAIFHWLTDLGYRFAELTSEEALAWTQDSQLLLGRFEASGIDHIDVVAEPSEPAASPAAPSGTQSRAGQVTSEAIRDAYSAHYYLEDCGGYETYRAHGGKILDPRLDCMARLAGLLDDKASLRVLDLGCGRGELARYFAALGHAVDAIDYSPEALRLAGACFAGEPELRRRAVLQCASVTDPGVYRGPYDLVLASDLIEHLAPEELDQLYRLIHQHLAADGVFIAHTFPNLWYYRYAYPRQRRLAAQEGRPPLPAEPRSPYELQMHINEQSPTQMRRQLGAVFPHVLLWAGDHEEPTGSLARRFGKSDWREARSLFAIASHRPVDPAGVIQALQRPPEY
nr:class I SAM-dependent methyltransferase [Thiorhodococcus minor]